MATWTNRGKLRLADGTFNANNLTVALLTATPTDAVAVDWNLDTDIVAELTTTEVSNYVRTALGTATITEDDTADESPIDYADTGFGSLNAPAVTPALQVTACVAIDLTSDEVMWVQQLTAGATPDGTPFTVAWATNGAAAVL